jgi:hypothetical protein
VSPQAKPAVVRFYFDADVLGLAKVLAAMRSDMTYPGDPGAVIHRRERPPCLVTSPAAKDTEWIPTVTDRGWLIVTRDRRIQHRPAELNAVRDAAARMVVFSADDAGAPWEQLEAFMANWRPINRLTEQPGPFIYTCTRTSLRPVDLP